MHAKLSALFSAVAVLASSPLIPAKTIAARAQHRDPLGFTVTLPEGWAVDTKVRNAIVIRDAARTGWILLHPFLLPRPVATEEWLAQATREFKWLLPQATIVRSSPRPEAPGNAVASVRFSLAGAPAQATLLCAIHGRTGMLYGIGAPVDRFAARRKALVQVLQSFHFSAPSAGSGPGPGPRIAYAAWQDPREGAFTVEVPQGWSASGGLFRFNTVDIRGAMEMASPDGQVRIIAGDPAIPPHTVPNQTLAMTGFHEGSWYSPGFNQRFFVRRYVPGLQFASEYAQSKLAAGCAGLRMVQSRELPNESRQLSSLYHSVPGVATMEVHAGEVAFTCAANGQPKQGYLFSGTLLISGQGYALWMVPFLHGFVASPESTGTAQAVLSHLLSSIRLNPQWVQRQGQATAATSRIISDTHAFVSRTIEDGFWAREKSRHEYARHWSNAILGQTDVVDPETGESWTVASGHNYYWRKQHTDTVAGTGVYDPPDTSFTPLLEY